MKTLVPLTSKLKIDQGSHVLYFYQSEEGYLENAASYIEDSAVVIDVKDEGIGMTEEQMNKLFIKYEKINQEQSGQGIGLFMVKMLVEHFDGNINVWSETCKGTTFSVVLPLKC